MKETPLVVLVVEDDPTYQSLVEQVSTLAGVSCSFVASGREALAVIDTILPAMLLIDYHLGDMDAPDLIARLHRKGQKIPFVIMTGFGNEEMAVEMMKLGALDYVMKDQSFLKRLTVALRSARDTLNMRRKLVNTQRELQEHRDYFRMFLEQSRDIVLRLDGKGRIRLANPAFFRETGSVEDPVGLYFKELISRDDHQTFDAIFSIEAARQAQEPREVEFRCTNGESIPVEIDLTPLPDSDESESDFIVIGRVLRERKRLEEQLRQSQKMEAVGRLAGGVAHDFNNILTSILGFSELIGELVDEDSELYEYISEVRNAAKRASDLTNQLLLFSRRQAIQPRVLQLNGFILDMRKMVTRLMTEDIQIEFDLADELMPVKADYGQLSQVMLNLVVNARDAMPDGGRLMISTQNVAAADIPQIDRPVNDWYVRFSVSDTGVGMPSDVLKKIFEPFFTTKGADKGTGLGLSVVYGIVSQHNGVIDVLSDEGFGALFNVYLPAALPQKRRNGGEKTSTRAMVQGDGQTVLVVEDEPRVRKIAQKILERNKFNVRTAINLKDALSVLDEQEDEIDLLFIDVVLGDGSGLDLARLVTTGASSKKVLLTSGYTGEKSQQETIRNEGYPFLQKPYSAIELLQAVNNVL